MKTQDVVVYHGNSQRPVFLPLAYRIRHSWLYQRLTLQLGSLLIVILAAIWLVERSFDLRVLG
jgi:hypothetical protein